MNRPHTLGAALAALLLSSCGPSTASYGPAATPPPPPKRSAAFYGRAPEGVAGADAKGLMAMFGEPRQDLHEPGVRKLQFSNGRCVLDAYLYPQARKKEPVVTHVDTRLSDGKDADQALCIASLKVE